MEDAKAAGAGALEMAQNWCKNGCTDETAEFLKGIFGHMNGGGCVDASVFCGPCATRATEYFSDDDNMLPCCIENVVQKGIEVNYTIIVLSSNIIVPNVYLVSLILTTAGKIYKERA